MPSGRPPIFSPTLGPVVDQFNLAMAKPTLFSGSFTIVEEAKAS